MITDAYSTASDPIITPESCIGPQRHIADTCIVTFSDVIMQSVLDAWPCETVGRIRTCGGVTPVYTLSHRRRTLAVLQAHVGSAMAASDVIETNWLTGASRFIVFGSCGCLDQDAARGRYILPTAAYRDEGMSYHYAPPADYIEMPGAAVTAKVFDAAGIPYVLGKTWTTDAFYRELRHQMIQRRAEGCLAVDMEAAGLQAVCDFHGFSLYCFLMAGDVLDQPKWDVGNLSLANHHLENFHIALKIAEQLEAAS
ncbi:MAG: nucleoside phosphorylase [Clostridia bacterium]|nr:nucleoside phosphorylase [Clostridia bacterium]